MKATCFSALAALLLIVAAGCSRQPAPTASGTPAQGTAPGAPVAAQPASPAPPASQGSGAGTPSTGQPAEAAGQGSAAPAGQPAAGATARTPLAGAAPPAAPAPPPRTFTLKEDRPLKVQLVTALSTKTVKTGDTFRATLASPIADGDWMIAGEEAEVTGIVREADEGGRVKGRASLTIALQSLKLADGRVVSLATSPYTVEAKSGAKKDAAKIGIGTAAGAGIGALVGGKKGAGVGALVGGGGATGATLATRGEPAIIPAGNPITFRLTQPVTITRQ